MKKSLSLVLLVACAALMLPVAAFASSADVDEPEAKPTAEATTYEQGIHEMEMPDGGIVKVGFSSTEQTGENAARSDCPMEIIRTRVISDRWTRQEFISRLPIIPALV